MDGGSDDEDEGEDDETRSEASYDETFKDMEEEVATLVADVHDLALYTKLNFTGFMKIVKKHDVSLFRFRTGRGTDPSRFGRKSPVIP